ncbi:MAG: hypothetical protein IKV00_04295 [Clostridia bacterium]|nr:hypothetical protein [Clostridia bacterium]
MMKKQQGAAWMRVGALLAAILLVLVTCALPTFAMGRRGRIGRDKGMLGRTGDAIESGAEKVESGAESIVDDLVDIPNGTDTNEPAIDPLPNDGVGDNADTDPTDTPMDTTPMETDDRDPVADGTTDRNDGLLGDEEPDNGTNIPDEDIGGAVEDNDHDGVSDPTDPDDDNDGLRDPVDNDADGDGVTDADETVGVIGIVIAVLVVIAIITLVIAVMPRARKK